MNQSERDLTQQSFETFLARLAANREHAGEIYEELRLMLVKFFEWRNALFPDELADETLNRVMHKLDAEAHAGAERIQNLTAYSYGVARLVFLESLKAPANKRVELAELPLLAVPPAPLRAEQEAAESEARLQCFRQCLRALPNDTRSLLEQYYRNEKRARIDHRKELARQLSLTAEALRRRAKLGRDKLELCVRRCLKRHDWADR